MFIALQEIFKQKDQLEDNPRHKHKESKNQ